VTGPGSTAPGLTARRYRPDDRPAWDALAAGARARHFLFQRGYMDYHADRFEDASFVVLRGGRMRAALPATRHGDEIISHGGLTFGGLLSDPELTVERAVEALRAIAGELRAGGATRLVVKPVPHIYHLGAAEEELYALHVLGARLVRREISAALAPTARAAPAPGRRRAIRDARARDLEVAQDARLEEFMALLAEVLRERHDVAPVHSPAEIRMLADRFPANIRLFTAREAGDLLAGTLIYETPAVAHTQYIATSPRGRALGAGDALLAHLIEERYPDRWFDFGISNERDGSLNPGLARFKEGFGARGVVYDRYELDLSA
jgi:hypothetical protein